MVLNHWKSEGPDVVVSYLPVWELCFSMHVLSNPDHHIYREKWAKRAEEMYSVVLAKRMSMLKERAEGVESMCKEMEKIYQEGFVLGETRGAKQGFEWGAKQGFERGMLEAKREHALSMAKIGLTVKQIAEVVKVEESVVEKWLADSLSAVQ